MAKTRPRFQTESIIKTWPMVRLGELGTMVRGNGIKRSETIEKGCPCLRYGEIYTSFDVILDKPRSFVPKELFDRSVKIKKGDLVFTLTGENTEEIAKALAYLGDDEIAAGGDLAVWTGHGCDSKYLAYLMYSPQLISQKAATGNGNIVVHTSIKKLQQLEIPLPPLSVQREIVARLERELAAVEKMKNGFETLAETAKAEFKAELKEVFEEISRGGAETRRLGDTFRFIDYRGMTPNKIATGVPLITAKNIRFGYMDYRERFYISEEDYAKRQTRGVARCGDILFTTEAPMGYVALADQKRFSTGQRIITFQWPNATEHNNRYFLYYFMSDVFQDQVRENASGATAQGIKSSRLVNLSVLIPECQKQSQVVARLSAAKARAEKLEVKAREGVAVCETMRKAILKEAFESSVKEEAEYG